MDENKNKIYKLVGAKVLYYRTLEGLTQEELANKIHIVKDQNAAYKNELDYVYAFELADGTPINNKGDLQ